MPVASQILWHHPYSCTGLQPLNKFEPGRMVITFRSVDGCPDWITHKKPHCFDVVVGIHRKTVIDACGVAVGLDDGTSANLFVREGTHCRGRTPCYLVAASYLWWSRTLRHEGSRNTLDRFPDRQTGPSR